MKLTVAILLNLSLLGSFVVWLRRQRQLPRLGRWVLPLLLLKLLAWGVASYRPSSDAWHVQLFANAVTRQLWESPVAWLQTVLGDEFHFHDWHIVYHGFSNTFFLFKLVSVLNLAGMGSIWLCGLYTTLFCFVTCWLLARTVAEVFPATPSGAALVGFLAWPTVMYWTSGLTKETLVLGSAAGLVAGAVQWLYGGRRPTVGSGLWMLFLAFLQFKMRYFFAALLFGALAGLLVIRVAQRLGLARGWPAMLLLLALVLGPATWAASEVTLVFRLNRITNQIVRTYSEMYAASEGRPRITLPHLTRTPESLARHAPQAVAEVLTRPWPWEGGALYRICGLENLLLLAVLAGAAWAVVRGRAGRLPPALGLVLLFYCLALAVLLGLSTPNLGTLNRYRSVLLPFLLWLALQNDYAARVLRRVGL